MRFGGQRIDDLSVAHHSHQPGACRAQWQRPVVKPAPAPQSNAGAVDCKRGNENHLGATYRRRRQPWLGGFAEAEPRGNQCRRLVPTPLQREVFAVGADPCHRQQDDLAEFIQPIQQCLRAGLSADRQVRADGLGVADQLGEMAAQLLRLEPVHLLGHRASGRQQGASVPGFGLGGHALHCVSADPATPYLRCGGCG